MDIFVRQSNDPGDTERGEFLVNLYLRKQLRGDSSIVYEIATKKI